MASSPNAPRFKRLLLNAVLVPIGLMLVIAALLAWQVNRLLDVSMRVGHSDEVIAGAYEAEKLAVDLETGLRGYMVTGDEEFLEPYQQAMAANEQTMARLRELVSDSPQQQQALEEIASEHQKWVIYAQQRIEMKRRGGDVSRSSEVRRGKAIKDAMQQHFVAFVSDAVRLRDRREKEVRTASKVTLALAAGMAILGGALLGFLSRRQFINLGQAYEQALQTANDLNVALEQRVADRTNELVKRSEQLVDANNELEAFAYSISHDLRAPMRHVTGFANLLRKSADEKLSAVEREYLATIDSTAKLAGQMVDDLLALSRVGRVPLHVSRVDLNEVVAQCRRDLEPDTRDREIEWKVMDLGWARGDPALLRLVFMNLLSNAVKYTGRKSNAVIEVGMVVAGDAQRDHAVAGSVIYFVRDNGVGFDMKYAGKLFGVFQRLHRAEDFEGTGIGLANVRRIITRHGGSIWVDAALEHGATFYFTLSGDAAGNAGETYEPHQTNPIG